MASSGGMDWSEVLERLGGDEELWKELATIFLESSPDRMPQMEQAMPEQDLLGVEKAAHAIT
ncbi:MAG: Hpt domain-containing protein [bacterium]|nr:Hpt domain-containing protein [bacterium]